MPVEKHSRVACELLFVRKSLRVTRVDSKRAGASIVVEKVQKSVDNWVCTTEIRRASAQWAFQ